MKSLGRKLLPIEDVPETTVSPFRSRDFLLPSSTPPSPLPTNTSTFRKPLRTTANFDSSMALTVLVLLTALFFMGFFSVYIQRCSEENSADVSRRRRQQRRTSQSPSSSSSSSMLSRVSINGLDPSIVRSLPMFSFDKNAKEPLDCAVCLSDFEEKETVKVIPYCGHVFHPECIDMWLSSHASCPLCRTTQLLPSVKKDGCLNNVVEEVQVVVDVQNVSESLDRSTVIEEVEVMVDVQNVTESLDRSTVENGEILFGMRRIRSCSSLGERVSLQGTSAQLQLLSSEGVEFR